MTKLLTIFVFAIGDESPFPVKIEASETVGALKEAIKQVKKPEFDHFAPDKLTLYQVALPAEDLAENAVAKIQGLASLNPMETLSDTFTGPLEKLRVHIVVKPPTASLKRKTGADLSNTDESNHDNDTDGEPASKRKPRHSSPVALISNLTVQREKTVRALYERLERYGFVLVRGTPASGKSTLAQLLANHMSRLEPAVDPILIEAWPKPDELLGYPDRRSMLRNHKGPNTAIIIDEAQSTYWDSGLWNSFLKPIIDADPSPYRVILFASYGSPKGRITDEGTPAVVPARNRVNLWPVDHGDHITPAGLFFTDEEFADMVEKNNLMKHFEQDFLDYVFRVTAGHAGAMTDLLKVVQVDDSYRDLRYKKYTLEIFRREIPIKDLWSRLDGKSIFRRGLPKLEELYDPNIARVFRAVLTAHSVTEKTLVSAEDKNALTRCFKHGWLHATTTTTEDLTVYIFTTPLHQWFVEYYLGMNVFNTASIVETDLISFAIKVIQKFSRLQFSSTREIDLSSQQRPPEAQFQDEFYRCFHKHTKGSLISFPEYGGASGRIDFYIPSKKWGVELLRDGDRLANHSSRFKGPGAYAKMEFKDYVILDFRTIMPQKAHPEIPNLFHVVLENDYSSVSIIRGDSLGLEVPRFELLNT